MPVFLGLDCGGSSIRAMAIDASGDRLYSGQGGAGNIATVPANLLASNLRKATAGCPAPDTVCGCFAGLLTPSQGSQAMDILKEIFPKSSLSAKPDYAAILRAEPLADVCVIAGTGSLVCSSHGDKVEKSGGRGYLLGDVGSAQAFGRAALNSYLDDPKRASSALVETIELTFHSLDDQEILAALYRSPAPAALLARFAKAVANDCEAGIPYAKRSVEQNFGELAKIVKTHIATHIRGHRSVTIALAGGLWKSSGLFKQLFVLNLSRAMTDLEFKVEVLRRAPVEGAADLAREMALGN